jgi:nucleotide-binding universal stress UspA family protein
VLLILDGSAQCLCAAEWCWQFCQLNGAKLDALHVINTPGIWEFLEHELPGLIGSGPYMESRELIRESLTSIGDSLMISYKARAGERGVEGICTVEEGNPIQVICQKAKAYDLVVVGNKMSGLRQQEQDRRVFPRLSIAERLICYCSKPILVIQGRFQTGPHIKIIKKEAYHNADLLDWCSMFAQSFPSPVGDKSQSVTCNFVDLKTDYLCSMEVDQSDLNIVPTEFQNGVCQTVFGIEPDKVLRYCTLPSILFVPTAKQYE